jgi:hypothetical protein
VAPASSERYRPAPGLASYNRYRRLGFAGVTPMFPLPTSPVGNPPASLVQLSPPLTLLKTPPSIAPEMIVQGFRSLRVITAKSTFGFPGCISTSDAPVLSLRKRTFSQVFPPSFVRKTPRSGLFLKMLPVAET